MKGTMVGSNGKFDSFRELASATEYVEEGEVPPVSGIYIWFLAVQDSGPLSS